MTLTPEDLIDKCPDLATLPSVYHKLNQAINSPSCTTGIISRIISQDPALTMKVLNGLKKLVDKEPDRLSAQPIWLLLQHF